MPITGNSAAVLVCRSARICLLWPDLTGFRTQGDDDSDGHHVANHGDQTGYVGRYEKISD
jgi:hypothetical protein